MSPYKFISSDGKRHSPKCIDIQGLFRIIQSIPSKKAEPFKRWLAQVGAVRIDQMHDPELGIQQSLADFKRLKGLHKENLRDNMTNEELVMNMLAELTTTNITKEEHPITMDEHAQVASRGGSVARVAREAFEQQTGKKVVTDLSMTRFLESQQPQLDFSEEKENKEE